MVAFETGMRTSRPVTDNTPCQKIDLKIVYTGNLLVGAISGLEGELVLAQILIEYPSSSMTVAVDDDARDDPNKLKGALFINGHLVAGTCVSGISELAVLNQISQKSLTLGFLFINSHPLDPFEDDPADLPENDLP